MGISPKVQMLLVHLYVGDVLFLDDQVHINADFAGPPGWNDIEPPFEGPGETILGIY